MRRESYVSSVKLSEPFLSVNERQCDEKREGEELGRNIKNDEIFFRGVFWNIKMSERGGFGNKNIKNWEPFMLNLFFMLRLFFFSTSKGIWKWNESVSERVHLRECDDFILFSASLYCQAFVSKNCYFLRTFSRKKNTHREFFYYLNAVLSHLETISEHSPSTASSRSTLYLFYFLLGRNEKIPFLVFFLALFIYKKIGMKAVRWKGWHICTGRCEMKKNEKKLKMVYTVFCIFLSPFLIGFFLSFFFLVAFI